MTSRAGGFSLEEEGGSAKSTRFGQQQEASLNDSFDQYIRGTERMEDPYWGTSEHSYNNQYHWTDGYGNHQHCNDPTFDPNTRIGRG